MGIKIAIVEFDKNNKAKKIDYFRNNTKGIGDFLILLNKELSKNNYNIRIRKVEEKWER